MAKKRERVPDEPQAPDDYVVTPPWAVMFAKLLTVGCPARKALLYIQPDLPLEDVGDVSRRWLADPLVKGEVDRINGGAFVDLPKEVRLQLVSDKLDAEAAYYLWETNFCDLGDKEELDKLKMARDMVRSALGKQVDELDPMQAFSRWAQDIAKTLHQEREAGKKGAPQIVGRPFVGSAKHRNDTH